MPTPQGLKTVSLRGRYVEPDLMGTPLRGTVTFTPKVPVIVFPVENTLMSGTETATLDNLGEFVIELVCTDTEGQNPDGWTYTVTEKLIGVRSRTYQIALPYTDQVVELSDIIPSPLAPTYLPVIGPKGADGQVGAPGVVQSVNGHSSAEVILTANDVKALPQAALTVDQYFTGMSTSSPRFFEHRGSGMRRPEHTMIAYRAAAAAGNPIEISTVEDATKGLWCLHDLTLDRTTYSTGALNTYTTEEIAEGVLTNGRALLGYGWTDQRMVMLRQALDELLGKNIIFLEAKSNASVPLLQTMLDKFYPHAPASVVWKCHIGTLSLPWAKARAYRTWVYVDDNTTNATLLAKWANIDYVGVPTTMADARISEIVQLGKPVFAWPVYRRYQRDRLLALGVVGFMCSDADYVSTDNLTRRSTRWGLGVKAIGGTPTLDYDPTYALKFEQGANAGWVSINAFPNQSYGLGECAPLSGSYSINFDMKYPVLPGPTVHGGYYFGRQDDRPYRFTSADTIGGYHMVMRANGSMELYKHLVGQTSGTRIGAIIPTAAAVADQPMSFRIIVTPATVELRRTDGIGWTTGPIADTQFRGGNHGLSNGSITDPATRPFWRGMEAPAI